jgi:hypothetical protein
VQFVGRGDQLRRLSGLLGDVVADGAGRDAGRPRRPPGVGKVAAVHRFVDDAGVPSVFFTAIKNAPASQQLAVVVGSCRYWRGDDAAP